ncbi:MAG TPA: formyl transferase [Flavobacteriales bacterium]|nr:formyl transferase [Flavobacteriales bacterium]
MAEDLIVLIGREGDSTNILYNALSASHAVQVIHEEPPARRKLLRWRVKQVGLFRMCGQLLFQVTVVLPMRRLSAGRRLEIIRESGASTSAPPPGSTSRTPSVNSPGLLAQLKELAPRLVVINGTRILTGRTLAAIGVPVLNVHAGITPKYRGVHGAYWALVNHDRAHCGVTVHLVDAGVDTGGILHQGVIEPTARDNFTTYPLLQLALGSKLLVQAVDEVLSGRTNRIAGPVEDRRWYHPTLWAYIQHWITRGVR